MYEKNFEEQVYPFLKIILSVQPGTYVNSVREI